jgi:cell division protein FtsZ
MTINLKGPELRELKPRITVCGVGGGGCNAVNNMIASGLSGVEFIVANTDAQALTTSKAERIIQMGLQVTEGLGAGAQPEVGRAAAEEAIEEIRDHLQGAHMCFVTAGMGGGTGTGAAPVIARAARDLGILTVGVVTKPFQFEGQRRMRTAEAGISELQKHVDTLIVIPNQNLFRIATERTTFADAFAMADQVLYSGVASITDLMVKQGLVNLDFADVRSIMREMGKAMMGTGEASGDQRAIHAAEAAIANPLLDEVSMKGARGLLISITGGADMTLYEVDEAASRIRQEVDEDANIILGATFDESLAGVIRVSVVATGIDKVSSAAAEFEDAEAKIADAAERLRQQAAARAAQVAAPVAAPAPAPVAVAPAPQPAYQQPARAPEPAPIAAFVAPQPAQPDLVHLAEMPVQPAAYYQPQPQPSPEPQPVRQAYVPPAAEQPIRPQRMPQVEDLPLPIQDQLRAYRAGEQPQGANGVEQRRRTLLERLASFASSREESAKGHREPQAAMPRPAPVQQPQARPPQQAPAHAEYAKRPAPRPAGSLDTHGRPAAAVRPAEEEQLEIPAFLRRQSSM